MLNLQRNIEDVFDDLSVPRSMRREMERLFDDIGTPQALWREMDRLMDQFDSPPSLGSRIARIFESFLGERGQQGMQHQQGRGFQNMFIPSVDLTEQEHEFVMKVDLPGMREQDIDVRLSDNNTLTISGERREEQNRNVRGYEYSERSYGSFSRSVELPSNIDASKIEADFRNGVLELHVPKGEAQQGRRIQLGRGREGGRDEPRVMSSGNGQHQQQGQQNQQEQMRQQDRQQGQQQRNS
jgi:HSP20 family protein